MNMKMYCDPGAELFSSTLMPTATPLSLPKATPSSSLDAMVWNLAGDTRGKLLSSSYMLWCQDAGGCKLHKCVDELISISGSFCDLSIYDIQIYGCVLICRRKTSYKLLNN